MNAKVIFSLQLVVIAGAIACADAGVRTRTFAVSSAGAGGSFADAPTCIYVPILLGSRVEARHAIDTSLSAEVSATREQVEVHFEGAAAPAPFRRIDIDLLSDAYEEQFDVTSATGEVFRVRLRSPCPRVGDGGADGG